MGDTIIIDTREKDRAIETIKKQFDEAGVKYISSKLYVGDYQLLSNGHKVIDRKQNLSELCSNVCQQHERFRAELLRAKENNIQLTILCEHGKGIDCLEDVIFWTNPRSIRRIKGSDGKWIDVKTKATTGQTLYNILSTLKRKYGVQFEFCDKKDTGKRIMELLRNDSRRD